MAEVIHGTTSADVLTAYESKTQVYGLAGDDTLSSDSNSEVLLIGGSGNDVLNMNGGDGTLSGGDGADTFNLVYSASKHILAVIEDADPYNDRINVTFEGNTAPQLSYTISGSDVVWSDAEGYFCLTLKGSTDASDYFDGTAHEYVWEILEEVNEEREDVGVEPLVLSQALTDAAQIRSTEIISNYSHTRPDGSSCFTAITKSYWTMGENIYSSPATAEDAVEGWMNSEGHRANILNSNFTKLGVGYTYDEYSQWKYHWVQMFGGGLQNPDTRSTDELLAVQINTDYTNKGDYTYNGGYQTISDFTSGQKILLNTGLNGADYYNETFLFYSNTGALVVENARNKVVDFRNSLGESIAVAYAAYGTGEIDGRGLTALEYIVGSDFGSNTIHAGNGGSILWGYFGNHADTLIGGGGEDRFFLGKYEGNDRIENASYVDSVNLYDATLSDLVAGNIDGNTISLTFNTGNTFTVQSTDAVSARFNLADGSAYRYNHSTKSWQGA